MKLSYSYTVPGAGLRYVPGRKCNDSPVTGMVGPFSDAETFEIAVSQTLRTMTDD
jgi:hypothetical protein